MKDWEKAEVEVAKLIKGYRVSGSGNKGTRGDVRKPGYMVEVKQTQYNYITLKDDWFEELIREKDRVEVALALFFELRGYGYFLDQSGLVTSDNWSSKIIYEDNLPEDIQYKNTKWKLENLDYFRNW